MVLSWTCERGQRLLEIKERSDAAMEMKKSQIFMDMAVLVDAQGEQLDDIKHYVSQANA